MLNIETTVNTVDDILFENVRINSLRVIPWITSLAAHDGHAVLVGGGPSVADWIEEIRWRSNTQTIFALNAASGLLSRNGITPDYQVVLDARASNVDFVGHARYYLFASQCDPSVFDAVEEGASLWHQHYPDDMPRFDSVLPSSGPEHALIGGGTTVGLSAMALAYALGFRKLHLYGYDSSYRDGLRHAYPQTDPQNIDCEVTSCGKTFRTSLAMAQQADFFPQLSDKLIDAGCTITIRGDGLLPWISKMSAIVMHEEIGEKEKYERMWAIDAYRNDSPGEECVEKFLRLAMPERTDLVYDIGAGTGRAAAKIAEHCSVIMYDIADNCLDAEVRSKLNENLRFFVADLREEKPPEADYTYCTDMLEHIEPHKLDAVLGNVLRSAKKTFLQISLTNDEFGALIGQPLHLSVHSFEWWEKKLSEYCTIEYSEDRGHAAIFYLAPKGIS